MAMPMVTRHAFTRRDAILYALGVGAALGRAVDARALRYVYEEGLQALPTMAVVLGYPGFWLREPRFGLDWPRILHAEQAVEIHRPLPVEGAVRGETNIENLLDKGKDKGAVLYLRREVFDDRSGELLATVRQTSFLRGDGGFGGRRDGGPEPFPIPDRSCDIVLESRTTPEQALIYRLSGDHNPVHVLPEVARRAGFEKPILHGLCTYGVVGCALVTHFCADDASRLRRLDVRFSSPAFPGDSIRTDVWLLADGKAAFQSRVVERDVLVLNNGYLEIR
ncbi:MAG: MaoC/PaaZ C-terminal domain-containing protein [Roseiarcus sp.]